MIRETVIVALGSAAGGILRFLAGKCAARFLDSPFPLATFTVNVLGSLLLGYLFAFFARQGHTNQELLLFLTVGFCGGFTTFSAFSHENLLMIRNGQLVLSCVYTTASVLTGIGAAWLGFSLVK